MKQNQFESILAAAEMPFQKSILSIDPKLNENSYIQEMN